LIRIDVYTNAFVLSGLTFTLTNEQKASEMARKLINN